MSARVSHNAYVQLQRRLTRLQDGHGRRARNDYRGNDARMPRYQPRGGGGAEWIGKLSSNLADCDTGTLVLYEQNDDTCPPEQISPTQTLTVLNLTGMTLGTAGFMVATKPRRWNHWRVFPAQIEVCTTP